MSRTDPTVLQPWKKTKTAVLFATEEALCSAFLTWLKQYPDWTSYAETAGWDILLAHRDGTQIGIQAKLKFNLAVLQQAIEPRARYGDHAGPDFRALLLPKRGGQDLCDALGLNQIYPSRSTWNDSTIDFGPNFNLDHTFTDWHYCNPSKRHTLPTYIPDVRAGVPSPISLTKWKIAALEICAIIEIRGYVTRDDFRLAGIDHRRWTNEWLEAVKENPGAYCWRDGISQNFSKQHPEVYPQIFQKMTERHG